MRKPTTSEMEPLVSVVAPFIKELTRLCLQDSIMSGDSPVRTVYRACMTAYCNGLLDGSKKVVKNDFDISVRALCESLLRRLENEEPGVQEETDPFKNRLN